MVSSQKVRKVSDSTAVRKMILDKVPVKLIKWVKIAHSFLQFVSNQFHIIILSLPM